MRELRNAVSRALTLRKGLKIDAPDICFEPGYQRAPPALVAAPLELPDGVTTGGSPGLLKSRQ